MLLQSVWYYSTLAVFWMDQIQDFDAISRIFDEELGVLDVKRRNFKHCAVAFHVLFHVFFG